MRKALTAKTIDALKPAERRYDVHDLLCPGFSVRVGKQGQKTFTVKYRYGLKQRRLHLGVYPRISLLQAREKALEALRNVDEGIDPATRRRQLSLRVEAVCQDFIKQYAKPRNRSRQEAERILQREFVAVHGQQDIRRVTRAIFLA
ncbi:Arm DNA-binding domain-containing protein [Novosphingobium guangzhouense]|uniref:Arm DNA-binding domain-containing protein n=1 Tax=Novosphingobium guangzhouense TaxID=1850347 RepID=UPI000CCC4F20|nr:Arm DNA-binding domain-containing protein [Novosphingobium guangzhouense]